MVEAFQSGSLPWWEVKSFHPAKRNTRVSISYAVPRSIPRASRGSAPGAFCAATVEALGSQTFYLYSSVEKSFLFRSQHLPSVSQAQSLKFTIRWLGELVVQLERPTECTSILGFFPHFLPSPSLHPRTTGSNSGWLYPPPIKSQCVDPSSSSNPNVWFYLPVRINRVLTLSTDGLKEIFHAIELKLTKNTSRGKILKMDVF